MSSKGNTCIVRVVVIVYWEDDAIIDKTFGMSILLQMDLLGILSKQWNDFLGKHIIFISVLNEK